MYNIELNIPSKYSHSRFLDVNTGKNMNLNKKFVDYFYTLVCFYRLELLSSNNNCLSTNMVEIEKKDKKFKKMKTSVIEENIDFEENLSFEFFQILNVTNFYSKNNGNSNYTAIRNFINAFKDMYVETNMFNKDKTEKSKLIKVFDVLELGSDNISMNVRFTKEYILPYLVTEKYFKKVNLYILFLFRSSYAKKIYLFLKDYSNCSKKIDKKKFADFLGEDFNLRKIEKYINSINKSDLNIEITKPINGKKSELIFVIRNKNFFITEDEELEYFLNEFILEDCQKITQNLIYDGKENIDNFEKYTKGIYDKKLKSDYEMSRYRSIYEIKLIIENHINNLKDKFNVSNEKHGILMFTDRLNNIDYESFFVNDQYELIDFATFEKIKLTPEKSLLRLKNAKVSIFNLPKNMKNYSLSSF